MAENDANYFLVMWEMSPQGLAVLPAVWLPSLVFRAATLELVLVGSSGKWITHKFHHRGYALITNTGVYGLTVIFLFTLLVAYAVTEVCVEEKERTWKPGGVQESYFFWLFLLIRSSMWWQIKQKHFLLVETAAWLIRVYNPHRSLLGDVDDTWQLTRSECLKEEVGRELSLF